jgi:hypothetical protein
VVVQITSTKKSLDRRTQLLYVQLSREQEEGHVCAEMACFCCARKSLAKDPEFAVCSFETTRAARVCLCDAIIVLLLLWNCKSITSLLWIPKTMYHVLGIELHTKQKFTECLIKRH